MKSNALTVQEYLENLPEERKEYFLKIREVILKNIPKGFEEVISYGMLGYIVPHSIYEKGYHCSPELPLPFMSLANQKGSINLYNMGMYADENIKNWFIKNYKQQVKTKIDMGKSCIRFKKMENIPYDLIGELVQKFSVQDWIKLYEKNVVKK